MWKAGDRRHEYDHHLGYDAAHHYDVVARCTLCHASKDGKATQTTCIHGHKYTAENTGIKPNGTRFCRACRAAYDKTRRNAAWWRAYRVRRNDSNG